MFSDSVEQLFFNCSIFSLSDSLLTLGAKLRGDMLVALLSYQLPRTYGLTVSEKLTDFKAFSQGFLSSASS